MIELTPIYHLFNSVLPTMAVFMVVSAVLSSLPSRSGNPENRQLKRAPATAPKLKLSTYRATQIRHAQQTGTKTYTIPTSMRSRSRHF
jgi:hypothetical protein